MPAPFTTPVALSTPFEPNRITATFPTGTSIDADNVQDAIEEAKLDALSNDRFTLLTHYGGNANVGRYTEWFPATSSLTSPVYLTAATKLLGVTCQTTAANATCTIGVFDVNVSTVTPVYTLVMSEQKRVSYVGNPLASFESGALVALRVTSGAINTPQLQVTFSAST